MAVLNTVTDRSILTALSQHKFIVFATDHFNSLGVIRSLGEFGIKSHVVCYGKQSAFIKSSKYINSFFISKDLNDCLEYIIQTFGNESNKPFIFATTDETESHLDLHFDELKDKFYFYNAGTASRVTQMMEKEYIAKIAETCGLNIPKTEEVNHGEMPQTLKFPIMTKSIMPTIHNWKSNVFICHNEQELKQAYTHIKQKRVVLQEYILKKNEINFEGFVINNGCNLYLPFDNRYHRTTEDSYGQYGYVERNSRPDLLEKIQELFKYTGFNGIFEIEFIIDKNDKLYFLEINFRTSAWVYAYTKCGINLPIMFAISTIEGKINSSSENVHKLPFHFMNVIPDFKQNVTTKKISLWQWIKDFMNTDCTFYYNKRDIKPFLSFMKSKIIN